MTHKKTGRFIFFMAIWIIIFSCSTEKNTFVTRTYHNLTAKYNAFYNGNESLKQGVKKMRENYKNDYSKILPVYKHGDEKNSKSLYPDMDKVIEKASKVINRHSITVKPKRKRGSRRDKEIY